MGALLLSPANADEPLQTLAAMKRVACPLLALHSRRDEVVPHAQATLCVEAAASTSKKLVSFDNSGHNDLCIVHQTEVVRLVTAFVAQCCGKGGGGGGGGGGAAAAKALSAEELVSMPAKELKAMAIAAGLDIRGCLEKSDYVVLLRKPRQ